MKLALIAIAGLASVASAQSFEPSTLVGPTSHNRPSTGGYTGQTDSVLWNNGGFETTPGNSTLALGDTVFGFGHQTTALNTVGDDFTVSGGGWNVSELVFYSYQTGSTTATSTFTAVTATIYAGAIGNTSSPVFTTTNLASSVWTGVYRTDAVGFATNRPIFQNTVTAVTTLADGAYWVAWNTAGSLASGPWAPPVTPAPGVTNGVQQIGAAGPWLAVANGTHGDEFPFCVQGEIVPAPASLALIALGGLVGGRRRR
jgi:uncharacterized protein (TIGR03382 family)